MNTVWLAILFITPQSQPTDTVQLPPVSELSDMQYAQAVELVRYGHLRSQLQLAETRLYLVTTWLRVAKNSGMPSFVLESIRRGQEDVQTTVERHQENILTATSGNLLHDPPVKMQFQLSRRLLSLTNEFRVVKAEESFIAALLAVAANAGMPSFVISKMRLEQEQMQRTVEILEGYLQEFRASAALHASKRSG